MNYTFEYDYDYQLLADDFYNMISRLRKTSEIPPSDGMISAEIGVSQTVFDKLMRYRERDGAFGKTVIFKVCSWMGVHPDKYIKQTVKDCSHWKLRNRL